MNVRISRKKFFNTLTLSSLFKNMLRKPKVRYKEQFNGQEKKGSKLEKGSNFKYEPEDLFNEDEEDKIKYDGNEFALDPTTPMSNKQRLIDTCKPFTFNK